LRNFIITRKIINIENGDVLDRYEYSNQIQHLGGIEWRESSNENVLINSNQLWNIKTNKVIELNFSEEKQRYDFFEENNTEIFINNTPGFSAILVDLETGKIFEKLTLEQNSNILRKSKYEFWTFSDSQIFLYSFLHSSPLKVFQFPLKNEKVFHSNCIVFGNYLIVENYKGVDLYCSIPRGCEKLETISNQNVIIVVDQNTGKCLLQYKHGVLVMKFKDELNIFSFVETIKLTDLKVNFV
jgi:hypothetical protein